MEVDNGFSGQTDSDEATSSKSNPEAEKNPATNVDQEQEVIKKGKGDENASTVPFLKLFSFADYTDTILMILGTIGAVGNGVCMPLMTVLFGELTDSFGENQNKLNSHQVVDAVSNVKKINVLYFLNGRLHFYFGFMI